MLNCKEYLSGGVVAAFECKTTLRRKHIEEFVEHSRKIEKLAFNENGTPRKDLQSKIYYGLLAHSHEGKKENSNPKEIIEKAIWEYNKKYITHPREIPDIICVADLGVWKSQKMIVPNYDNVKGFRYCVEHGHLCVMRLKEGINLSKKCNGDMISILQGTSKEGTSDVTIRVLEIPLDDGTKEYLATNLFDPAVTKDMFQELYFYRWPVELKYKELKSRFAMEEFSGATAVSIQQEFYINMLLSNLASLIKNEADEEIQISAKSTNKFRYQANRAFIIGRIKSIIPKILCGLFELSIIEQLYTDAVRCRSQLLPGRSFPRKKLKSKGRSHFRNKKVSF